VGLAEEFTEEIVEEAILLAEVAEEVCHLAGLVGTTEEVVEM
jgi:hypothetical protein